MASKKCGILDDRSAEPLVDDASILRQRKYDGECKSFFSRDKTAKLLTQRGRQHRHCTLDEVDTCSPLAGVAVEGSVGLDEIGNIGDVNTDVKGTVLVRCNGQRIIDVLGTTGVNGEEALGTQILANLEFALGNAVVLSIQVVTVKAKIRTSKGSAACT